MITANTKLYGLVGQPIGHSKSPIFQNYLFERYQINGVYVPFETEEASFEKVFFGLKQANIKGLNITIPFKERVLPLLDEIDPVAQQIGAVNTVVFAGGKSYGYNTDVLGFEHLLEGLSIPEGGQVHVLGAGGAARAVLIAIRRFTLLPIRLYNRTVDKGVTLLKNLDISNASASSLDSFTCQAGDLVINCTPVGLVDQEIPIEANKLANHLTGIDLLYKDTLFLKEIEKRGGYTRNGLDMLLAQGVASFKIWTGHEASIDEAKQAF